MVFRVGVDVGGTFTDLTIIDEDTGEVFHHKGLTTPHDPSVGTLGLIKESGVSVPDCAIVVHGTTVVINALVERKGAKTGLITTNGFRDILEIRHGARTSICDPFVDKPSPFIPRPWRLEVAESMASDGGVREALDRAGVESAIDELKAEGVEAVAICLINSHANAAHEEAVGDLLRERWPGVPVTLSSVLTPRIGEYERFSTAMINAYTMLVVARYLEAMWERLKEMKVGGNLFLMQSNGGIMTWEEATQRPIQIIESGPAGGVIGARGLGEALGLGNLITFDMGGTTSKSGIIENGEPRAVSDFELLGVTERPGSGWPLLVPMMDITEIGAGGGSIASLDLAGSLRVGPESAGADPGPVCYAGGGSEPTLTDANVVLGILSTLLDGTMVLDAAAARKAVEERIAKPLKLDAVEAASGIRQIAVAKSADLLREVTIAKGLDPRDFVLVACGGAGPMHAADLLPELEIRQAIIPPSPGNFCALGMISTGLRSDYVQSRMIAAEDAEPSRLTDAFEALEHQARRTLERQKIKAEVVMQRSIDTRYKGQVHEVNVPVPDGALDVQHITALIDAFHRRHEQLWGHSGPGEATEFVNFRLTALGRIRQPSLKRPGAGSVEAARLGERPVFFTQTGDFRPTAVYARHRLGEGNRIEGPAVIEEYSSISVVPPGFMTMVDGLGNLVIERT